MDKSCVETYEISENMKKFFDNLFELKKFIKHKYESEKLPVIKEIYDRLDAVIKEEGK